MLALAIALRRPERALAILTAVTLLAWTLGLPAWIHDANAAAFTNVSDTISDSDVGATADHTIQFTTPTAIDADVASGDPAIEVTFPLGFDLSSVALTDVDLEDDGSDLTVAANCLGGDEASYTLSGQTLVFQLCNGDGGLIATSSVVTLQVGTVADGGANGIVSTSTAGSYVVQIQTLDDASGSGGTVIDEADTRIAVIDDVTVTASVDTIFTFSINPVLSGATVNDDATVTSDASTATTVPFGTLADGTAKLIAQELRIDTNAANGFSVTVFADQTLTSGNGATIDEFTDGNAQSTTTSWASPAGTLGSDDTYGHWGITTDDDEVSGATSTLYGSGEALYRGDFVGQTNAVEVFYHDAPVLNTSGQGIGSTRVAYKAEITALQEAAKDYTATLTYVATPVF